MTGSSTNSWRRSSTLLLLLAFSAPLARAAPLAASTTEPYIAERSHHTPSAQLEPPASYLPNDTSIASLIQAMAAASSQEASTRHRRAPLDEVLNVNLLQERDQEGNGDTLVERDLAERAPAPDCLDSTATEVLINSLFHYGGAGTVIFLCQRAKISLAEPIFFSAPDQVLATKGESSESSPRLSPSADQLSPSKATLPLARGLFSSSLASSNRPPSTEPAASAPASSCRASRSMVGAMSSVGSLVA